MALTLRPPFRLATGADAPVLAELVNYAGKGMPEYLWSTMAGPGQDPWEIGRQRQAKKAEEGQIFVVDEGNGAIASLTGYAISPDPEPIPDDMPAMFRPLQELENMAPATWYVNVLATVPTERGKGHGTRLLSLAEELARDAGLSGLSIIVAGNNHGACRLYERSGYREIARRANVPQGWQTDITEWVLLIKPLG